MITEEGYKRFFNFIIWCIFACFISFIGISNVMASSLTGMKFIGRNANQYPFSTYYDPSTYPGDYFTFNGSSSVPNYLILDTCSTGPLNFIITQGSGHFDYLGYLEYTNNTCNTSSYEGYQIIYYFGFTQFTDAGNGNLGVSFTLDVVNVYNYNTYVTYNNITFSDSSDLRSLMNQNNIINNQNENTQDIINNQNQNTQDIIDNQNQNTQDIINNQNANTEKEIESQIVCNEKVLTYSDTIEVGSLNSSGVIQSGNYNWGVTDYIELNKYIKIDNSSSASLYCLYDINKTLISCSRSSDGNINLSNNVFYGRFSIRNNDIPIYTINICKNGNQALTDSVTNLNDSINNDDIDDNGIGSAFEDFDDYLDDNSTITQLITLPITLYTAILNNLNGTCQPFNLGNLFGEDLILPCINISQYLGNSLWTMIDIIISGFAIFRISKKMIKVFNNFSSLREGDVIDD